MSIARRKHILHCLLLTASCLLLMLAAGCEWFEKKASEVKQAAGNTTQQVVERAKQTVNAAGNVELTLAGTAVKTSGCYGELTVVGSGRPAVFQVKSSDNPTNESFPSLHFWALSSADNVGALANQTLQGLLWVQLEPDGAVWHTPEGEFAHVTIQTAAEGAFTAKLAQCRLVSTGKEDPRPCTGTFSGSLK
jgi:hypothetical protein